ncbi:hypothetical protein V2J09_012815 [Rumex salicifolius]
MGATGAGKSRLSIDLATRFPFEIINSDKIQIYKGLDITTNKIPFPDRAGVPHHLLGDFDSSAGDVSPSKYRLHGASVISQIVSRRRHPLLVGGSNSFVYALLSDRFDSDSDPLEGLSQVSSELRYRCCFLWVDVSLPVLNEYLVKRVDEMLDSGMMEELAEFYASGKGAWGPNAGLRKAIGVPEFERYFGIFAAEETGQVRRVVYEEAVRAIKDNTCQLAKRQMEKIGRLRSAGWDLQKLDATDSFRGALDGSDGWEAVWERQVVEPSVKIVKRFLELEE